MVDHKPVPDNWKFIFALIFSSQSISMFGSALVQFALVWWITQKTGSAVDLTLATMATLLPSVFLGPFIGALVDRWNRKLTIILSDAFTALGALVLVYLYWGNLLQVWHIYVLLFLRSAAGIFQWPAVQSSIGLLVPENFLTKASGLNMAVHGAINIGAPPLGALLITWLPMHGVMLVDVLTAAIAIILLSTATVPEPVRKTSANKERKSRTVFDDVKTTARLVWNWKGLRNLLILAVVLNMLVMPAFSLFPLLITRHYQGGVWQLSYGEAVAGIGMVLGGLAVGLWGGFKRRMHTMVMALTVLGIGGLVTGFTNSNGYWVGMAGMFLLGFANPFSSSSFVAIMQTKVTAGMQGRVFTLSEAAMLAASPLALLAAGPLADRFGVTAWYLIYGFGTLLLVAFGLTNKHLMHLEDDPVLEEETEKTDDDPS